MKRFISRDLTLLSSHLLRQASRSEKKRSCLCSSCTTQAWLNPDELQEAWAPLRDEKLELVDRICASGQLRRSVRSREFLKYVSQQSIDCPAAEIPEQQIVVQVFVVLTVTTPARTTSFG